MLRPAQDEFQQLATRGTRIPVVREIRADMDTALSLFARIDDGRTAFLLESAEGSEKWGRYSFMGVGARAIFRAQGASAEWTEGGETRRLEVDGDPLLLLRERLARARPVVPDGLALPRFAGGAVGMVGWDWVRFVERIPDRNPDRVGLPDLWFVIPDTVVVYDNLRYVASVVHFVELEPGDDPGVRYREAVAAVEDVVQRLRRPLPPPEASPPVRTPMDVSCNVSREQFLEMVKRAKDHVEAGDVFQVVLSQQLCMPLQVDPFTIYRQLRCINPSPYLFFLRCDGPVLIGASPEVHVRLEDGRIDLRPIAGTRPRGRNPAEDEALEREMREDPKERAEHVMLVDLGRNDVGRVAETGSVDVNEFFVVERYSHVMHLVSNVQGRLREGLDWLDLLRATFPAGTLSGAPKVRAMEIIDDLENVRRGPYGGCVGYVDFFGNMDTAITIRTLAVRDDEIFLQAGAGIVADSVPELEHEECQNKARALVQAIDMAREGLD